MHILTIDTGTTNTRVTVWRDQQALCQAARQVGVRDTAISGSPVALQNGVRQTIAAALDDARLEMAQIDLVLGSGMITSNVGLHEVPHVLAPAGAPRWPLPWCRRIFRGVRAAGVVCAGCAQSGGEHRPA